MRVIEMECEACARLVRTSKDGDRCGPCDLAMCTSCLSGTVRCPSCQKTFTETRDRAPVVMAAPKETEPPWLRLSLLAGLAIALGFAYVSFSGPSSAPAPERVGPIHWGRVDVPLSSAPCTVTRQGHAVPDGPLLLPDMLGGPRVLRSLLAGADATLIAPPEADLVVNNVPGPAATDYVLVIDEWQPPIMLNNTGRLRGRVFLRGRDQGRILCGGAVDIHDRPGDTGSLQGTQTARVELVRAGLQEGLTALRAVR